MRRPLDVLYVLAMVAVIITVDAVFFKHRIGPRVLANIGIVLAFAVFYLTVLRRR